MIVLDEHLTDESLKNAIARWHQGRVAFIKTLRLGTLIKDDAASDYSSATQTADFCYDRLERFLAAILGR